MSFASAIAVTERDRVIEREREREHIFKLIPKERVSICFCTSDSDWKYLKIFNESEDLFVFEML